MKAWIVGEPGPMAGSPLRYVDRELPTPGEHEVRVRVHACGVCRTDLHLAEGDLAPKRAGVVPGHEVVGVVDLVGAAVTRFAIGDRVGIAWLGSTCGACRWCRGGRENLCVRPRFTGWDDDGGYAEYAVVNESYGYAIPDGFSDVAAAPLLCAGIIGYRALKVAALPPGGRLGIYGFGASAHLAAQVALRQGARVHVMTRSEPARELALSLGVDSAVGAAETPAEPLDAAILFAPVGTLVPSCLSALDRGGTLAIAGIHLSDIPVLSYQEHLFQERAVRSVTANTRADGEEFLALAARMKIRVETTTYGLDQADVALRDLSDDRVNGAAVLLNEP